MKSTRNSFSDNYNKPFPTALRKIMESTGKTQKDISEFIGKKTQSVSQYVNGQSEPGYETLVKIADYFNCSVDYLLGRTEDPSMNPCATDDLGLSPEAIGKIKQLGYGKEGKEKIRILSNLFNTDLFLDLIKQIYNYSASCRAEIIYKDLYKAAYPILKSDKSCKDIDEKFYHLLRVIIDIYEVSDGIYQYLMATRALWHSKYLDGDYARLQNILHGFDSLNLSDIEQTRISRTISSLLTDIKNEAAGESYKGILPDDVEKLIIDLI